MRSCYWQESESEWEKIKSKPSNHYLADQGTQKKHQTKSGNGTHTHLKKAKHQRNGMVKQG
jgi:hypothetical protein